MTKSENRCEKVYWLHAVSPLHVGAGRGVGYIDLPIHREKSTGWPLVPGSALKGVLADEFGATEDANLLRRAFGRAGDDDANAGSLVFTDAHLAALPVRSFYGTFAWVSSPLSLMRLKRNLRQEIACVATEGKALVPDASSVLKGNEGKIYLEDLDFPCETSAACADWANVLADAVFPGDAEWQAEFKKRFAVLPDDAFDFLCRHGTEVNARVRIDDDKKSVARGALWYEESLPAETILAGVVWCDRVYGDKNKDDASARKLLLDHFCGKSLSLQLGGKASVGKGQVRCLFGKVR